MNDALVLIRFFLAGLTGLVVALVTLHWFFKDGDESTRSFEAYYDSLRPLSFRPWWTTKFGVWVAISGAAAYGVYYWFPILVQHFWSGA